MVLCMNIGKEFRKVPNSIMSRFGTEMSWFISAMLPAPFALTVLKKSSVGMKKLGIHIPLPGTFIR